MITIYKKFTLGFDPKHNEFIMRTLVERNISFRDVYFLHTIHAPCGSEGKRECLNCESSEEKFQALCAFLASIMDIHVLVTY